MVSNFRPRRELLCNVFLVLLLFLAGLVSACGTSTTAGPDGNLWFTEIGHVGSSIGRITTSGNITEFPLPSANTFPSSITAGKIGRITTAGKISYFPLPTSSSSPTSITFGIDHTLWFIEVVATPADSYGKNGKVGHLV